MKVYISVCLGFRLLTEPGLLTAQIPVPERTGGDTLHGAASSANRIRRLDSLEVSLLKSIQTYQQVERLLVTLPSQSPYLDLLPGVLPVDLPIDAFRITSPFGTRSHPIHKQIRFHGGVDVKAASGMAVKATARGFVRQVGYDAGLGVFVRLQHAFGFETTYGHLAGYCVKPGQEIRRNQEIGRVGQTGLATGPHLHYTLKKTGPL